MIMQMRLYTINRGELSRFASEWQAVIRPLRESLGFRVRGAWLMEETNQFVWLLAHAGTREDWHAADASYYASPARLALMPDPARLIARAEEYFVTEWPGA